MTQPYQASAFTCDKSILILLNMYFSFFYNLYMYIHNCDLLCMFFFWFIATDSHYSLINWLINYFTYLFITMHLLLRMLVFFIFAYIHTYIYIHILLVLLPLGFSRIKWPEVVSHLRARSVSDRCWYFFIWLAFDWNAILNIDQLHAMPEDIFDILDFWQSFKFSLTSHIQRH